MKTYKHLFEKLITRENIELAIKNSQKGKKNRRAIKEFNEHYEENVTYLIDLLKSGKFHTSQYTIKTIYEPKEREIFKLPYFPDRIVQHAIMNVLKPVLLPKFIENSFACIEKRGQHKASDKCYQFVQRYKYCLKCDIKKFYPSIDQHILSTKLHTIIKDDQFMNILDDIIFSIPGGKNCPIGNYCSQWFGNFYLTSLDNFVYHRLQCHAYLRYCDDFMIFSDDKNYLHFCRTQIGLFLNASLKLQFSKSIVFNVKQGVDFCGYRHFKWFKLVRKSTVLRLRRRILYIISILNIITVNSIKHFTGQVSSAIGILSHANTVNLRKTLGLDNIYYHLCVI